MLDIWLSKTRNAFLAHILLILSGAHVYETPAQKPQTVLEWEDQNSPGADRQNVTLKMAAKVSATYSFL